MATTPTHDWPTPDNVDRVADGASAIRALGDAIDATVPLIYAATGTVGTLVASGSGSVAVTFPVGLFATTPIINVTPATNIAAAASSSITGISAAGCTVVIQNMRTTGPITGDFHLLAVLS